METRLQMRFKHYEASEQTFLQSLTRVAAEAQIPMGIEWVETPETMQPVHKTFADSTVKEILEAIVRSHPGYALEFSNGIVHIFPKKDSKESPTFLNLYVDNFSANHESVAYARNRLRRLIQHTIRPPVPRISGKAAGEGESIASGMGDKPITFTLSHVRMRDILDEFAKRSDLKIWIVTDSDNPRLLYGKVRRTKSLRTRVEIPDKEQPVWEQVIWGFDPGALNIMVPVNK